MAFGVMHRLESVFDEPERFMPERWIGENAKKVRVLHAICHFLIFGCSCVIITLGLVNLEKRLVAQAQRNATT